MAIEDFGKKIGGARKDVWSKRGLMSDDLVEMNSAELDKHVKKDNIWKRPDYQAFVDSGIDKRVVWFYKVMRDATPVRPVLTYVESEAGDDVKREKVARYVDFVGELRDAVMACKTIDDIQMFHDEFFIEQGYFTYVGSRTVDIKEGYRGIVDSKLINAAHVSDYTLQKYERDIAKKEFCYSEDDKKNKLRQTLLNQINIVEVNSDNVKIGRDYRGRVEVAIRLNSYSTRFLHFDNENEIDWKDGTYLMLQNGTVLAKNIEKHDDIVELRDLLIERYVSEQFQKADDKKTQKKTTKKRKGKFVPEQLKGVERVGDKIRYGQDVNGDDYLNTFGFKGGEFGNYMNENDRRVSMNMGYEALIDMCRALNIAPSDVSLNGRLSIAFGARGIGGSGAAAHYEPEREVINLTKMNGAGSLAHEWAHAMDDIIGKELGLGRFMSESIYKKECLDNMKTLVNDMKNQEAKNGEIDKERQKHVDKRSRELKICINSYFNEDTMSEEQIQTKNELIETMIRNAKDDKNKANAYYFDERLGHNEIQSLSELHKVVTGRVINRENRKNIAAYQYYLGVDMDTLGKTKTIDTQFYADSKEFDKHYSKSNNGYWSSTVEMFARAFSCYVTDKVAEMQGKNDYLSGHSDVYAMTLDDKTIYAYPRDKERQLINECFDKLIDVMKEKGIMHDFEFKNPFEKMKEKPRLDDIIRGAKEVKLKEDKGRKDGQLAFDFDL